MEKILIVEDDRHISELIRRNLQLVGYDCVVCHEGREMERCLREQQFNLILLDVMLPGLSGFDLIGKKGDVPVIFVTAKGELEDKIQGLTLGAEDYIVKPFEMMELIARVGVVLRRFRKEEVCFQLGEVEVNLDRRSVKRDGEEVDLTPREFALLEVLVENRNIALSRDKLLELAWGYDYEGETKTVDVHIQRLRKKLGWEKYIRTVMKVGYRLEVER
ncbi:MAG: response regulator transcription factor [Lachnospiraceae bacterium]|nr:response regulator transcription factor [Lachnospiraceae bacterium]